MESEGLFQVQFQIRTKEMLICVLKEGTHEDSLQAVEARAVELRKWLWKRPESNIVLVSHGAFLHYLTEDWDGFDPMRGVFLSQSS
jgi:broad specificity phosphatase PhoE